MDKEYEKFVLHVSAELSQRLSSASEKLKLSRGSIIRQALDEFLSKSGAEKKKGA
jgi:predicted transcriptional regulator